MLGKFVGVVVNGDKNSTANAVTAVAVADADAADLRIVDAKQSGAKTVKLTFSNAVTASDKITVKKGSNEIKLDGAVDYDVDFKSATITLADKITASDYEVTFTPANTKIAASTAKFTGELSALKEIKFLNKVLVMSDNTYSKGYAYVKGYDQFGGEVTLSGLTVNAGVGTMESYDSTTGRLTLTAAAPANAYMLIKEVPVFVQYQQGNDMITANETLTVSTQAFVNDIVYGDVKKDGTGRDDGLMTITELNSGKYYVELNKVQDQYGNDMDAEQLNDQMAGANKTLFVIPDAAGSFYSTGKFGTINKKVVLWLNSNGGKAKPGTMALTITGAGGKSFQKDITVSDDPMIQTLTVSYPELYKGSNESKAFEFSAVDQYGEAIDMWDVKPTAKDVNGGTAGALTILEFSDTNHLTNNHTTITVGSNVVFNAVKEDTSKKTFKVTVDCSSGAVIAKNPCVFTINTAGMSVSTSSITIGEEGTAAKVKSTLSGGDKQITTAKGDNANFNFNKFVQFEDANGNTMSRGDASYPAFVAAIPAGKVLQSNPNKVAYTNGYAWSLSTDKVSGTSVVGQHATGKVVAGDITATSNSQDFYVTVYGVSAANDYYVLDDESFRLSKVVNYVDKKYTVKSDGLLYAVGAGTSGDDVEIKVSAKNEQGETYDVAPGRITVEVDGRFPTVGNKIYSASTFEDKTTGTVKATVFVDGDEAGTVDVPYSNVKPEAKTAKFKFETNKAGGSSLIGADFDNDCTDDEFTAQATTTYTIENGTLTIKDANSMLDKITACIEDQYGQPMKSTTFARAGINITNGLLVSADNDVAGTKRAAITYKNDSVSGKFYVTPVAGDTFTVKDAATNKSASDAATLDTLLSSAFADPAANEIHVTGTIAALANAKTIASNDTLVIDKGATLAVATPNALIVQGKLINNGAFTVTNTGGLRTTANESASIENNGIMTLTQNLTIEGGTGENTFTNNGDLSCTGTLTVDGKMVNKGTCTGAGNITGAGTVTNNAGAVVDITGTIEMTQANTFENAGKAKANSGISGYVKVLSNDAITDAGDGNYSANTIVAPGVTATLKDSTGTATITADANSEVRTAIGADLTDVTIKSGSGSATDSTGTETEATAEASLADVKFSGGETADLKKVINLYGSKDLNDYAGSSTLFWAAAKDLDAYKYYYVIIRKAGDTTKTEWLTAANNNNKILSGRTNMVYYGDFNSNLAAVSSWGIDKVELWVSDTELTNDQVDTAFSRKYKTDVADELGLTLVDSKTNA